MYWLKLVSARFYAQSKKNIDFAPDVYWTAYFSLTGVVVAVIAGLLKSLLNAVFGVAKALAFTGYVGASFRRSLFIAALIFGVFVSAMLLRHLKAKEFDFGVAHLDFSFYDFVSRFIVPFSCFLVFAYGDSWAWFPILLVGFGAMNLYARRYNGQA